MDIAKVLRKLPKNTKLYSPAFGNVELTEVNADGIITIWSGCGHQKLFCDGTLAANGECMLFPSADNRDWESLETPKFDVKTLNPFDRVLTRNSNDTMWTANLFSNLSCRFDKFVCMSHCHYIQCVPFNEDTKHLLGTIYPAPEYYITWD